ncbi:MAG: hypothetical protein AAF196_07680 [Planctomycetota bacterium]
MIDSTVPAAGLGGRIQRAGAASLGLAALTVCCGALSGDLRAQDPANRQTIDWGSLGPIGSGDVTLTEAPTRTDPLPVLDEETGAVWIPQDPQGGETFEDAPEDGDYSPQSLFQRLHGNFLRSAFFYQPNLKLGYRFQSARDVDTNFAPGSTVPNDVGDFDINEFQADWNFNYAIDPDLFLITGISFGADVYDFSGTIPQLRDEEFYQLSAKIGAGWFINDDVLVQAYWAPGYYSDFDGSLTSDDVQNFGRALATVKLDESFYVHGGVEVTAVFEDVPVYPLLGFTAILSEEWRIDLLAPRELAVRFSPSPEWTFSTGLTLNGSEFNYRAGAGIVPTAVPPLVFPAAGTGNQFDVNIQEFGVFGEALYRVNNQFSLYGRFGSTLAARYDYRVPIATNGAITATGDFDGDVSANITFEIGVGLDL